MISSFRILLLLVVLASENAAWVHSHTNVSLAYQQRLRQGGPDWLQSISHANQLITQRFPRAALRKIFLLGPNSRENYADPSQLTKARLIYSETLSDTSATITFIFHWPTRDPLTGRTIGGSYMGPYLHRNGWHYDAILDFRVMDVWTAHETIRRITSARYWYIELWQSRRKVRGLAQSCFMFKVEGFRGDLTPTKVFVGTRDGMISRGFEATFEIGSRQAGIEAAEAAAAA